MHINIKGGFTALYCFNTSLAKHQDTAGRKGVRRVIVVRTVERTAIQVVVIVVTSVRRNRPDVVRVAVTIVGPRATT